VRRREFIKELIKAGYFLKRHGSRHDVYVNPTNGKKAPISRHKELKDTLCKLI